MTIANSVASHTSFQNLYLIFVGGDVIGDLLGFDVPPVFLPIKYFLSVESVGIRGLP